MNVDEDAVVVRAHIDLAASVVADVDNVAVAVLKDSCFRIV